MASVRATESCNQDGSKVSSELQLSLLVIAEEVNSQKEFLQVEKPQCQLPIDS